jgi:hypothetical protein
LCAGAFAGALSKAIFIWHQADYDAEKARLVQLVSDNKMEDTEARELLASDDHLNKFCRRVIPEPATLATRLQHVHEEFAAATHPTAGPLYTKEMAAVHARQMKLVEQGRLTGE